MKKLIAVGALAVAALAFTSEAFARGGGGHGGGGHRGGGSSGGSHSVRPHITRDGVYVPGHRQTNPNSSRYDNWSTKGNTNPYTGKPGSKCASIYC